MILPHHPYVFRRWTAPGEVHQVARALAALHRGQPAQVERSNWEDRTNQNELGLWRQSAYVQMERI